MITTEDPEAIVDQAKEKFGDLRVYIRGGNGTGSAIGCLATIASRQTYEECSRPASQSRSASGRYATVCKRHSIDHLKRVVVPLDEKPRLMNATIAGKRVAAVTSEDQACLDRPDLLAMLLPEQL